MTEKEERIIEQVYLLLNMAPKINDFRENDSDLFRIYSKILREIGKSDTFCNSLLQSDNCFKNKELIPSSCINLLKNDPDSFLIVPLIAKGHLFPAIIKLTDEGYNTLLANKGRTSKNGYYERGETSDHQQFEEFIFKEENLNKLCNILDFQIGVNSIDKFYEDFEKNSHSKYILNLKSREQITENCYYKECELAIKVATFLSTRTVEQIKAMRFDIQKTRTVKWSISVKEIHDKYIDILSQENPDISDKLKYIKKAHDQNIIFRSSIRDLLKENIDIEIDLDKVTLTGLLKKTFSTDNLMEALSKLEYRSIISYQNILGKLKNFYLDEMIEHFQGFYKKNYLNHEIYINKLNELEIKFPVFVNQFKLDKSFELVLKFNEAIFIKHKEEFLDYSITFNPRNSVAHFERGKLYECKGCLTEAISCFQAALKFNPSEYKDIAEEQIKLCLQKLSSDFCNMDKILPFISLESPFLVQEFNEILEMKEGFISLQDDINTIDNPSNTITPPVINDSQQLHGFLIPIEQTLNQEKEKFVKNLKE